MNAKTLVFQARRAVAMYGARGALKWAGSKVRDRVLFAETHIWYELDPTAERPRRPLEAGLTLRRGELADVSILKKLETLTPDDASHRIDEGNHWWLVLDRDQILFSCWIFPRRTPVLGARAGELALADGMVCLEDSMTTAAARGRGIAPAAWSAIADGLGRDGQRRIVTKVTVENIPSRKAVEKIGFEPVAMMSFKRIGPLTRTFVKALDQQRGQFFTERLQRNREPR